MAARKFTPDFSHTKLIVILGSTATGKSKLGIELAKAFNGEVISADSMQVYKGLDVITNKVTPEESEDVRHHLIDVVSPTEEFTVVEYKKQALKLIEDMATRDGKLPVIVGGTNYFIESLLWDFLINDRDTATTSCVEGLQSRKNSQYKIESEIEETTGIPVADNDDDNSQFIEQLMRVDPERANQLHPNNVRKIARSLQIYYSTGKTHSQLIDEQKRQNGSSNLSGPLRFPKSLVFWLTAEQSVLDERISTRVDSMIEKGLLNEIRTFYENHIVKEKNSDCIISNKDSLKCEIDISGFSKDTQIKNKENNGTHETDLENVNIVSGSGEMRGIDHACRMENAKHESNTKKLISGNEANVKKLCKTYEEGLFQAIGFKEFHPYLIYTGNDEIEKGKLLSNSLQRLKDITIRYSKKQKRWVQNRFLARPKENALSVYNLDTTNLEDWGVNVLIRAKEISRAFLDDLTIPYDPLKRIDVPFDNVDKHRKYICSVCNDRVIIGDIAWQMHQQSRKHKKLKAKCYKS